jgi:hypothetical protein
MGVLGCKMTQSSPPTLKGGGVSIFGEVFLTTHVIAMVISN